MNCSKSTQEFMIRIHKIDRLFFEQNFYLQTKIKDSDEAALYRVRNSQFSTHDCSS